MEAFLGKKYKLKSSENFDEYLQFLGKNFENCLSIIAIKSGFKKNMSFYNIRG